VTGVLTTIHANPHVMGAQEGAEPRRHRRWPTPYQLLGTAAWLLISATAYRLPIAADFGQHAAAVERIRANWLHPTNPLIDVPGAGSPYYTPYTLVLGLVAKATGLPGWELLKGCGPLNLAVLLTGIAAFTHTLSSRRWAPVAALAAYLLLWGPAHMEWSGFLGLQSMVRGISYPSTLAVGLTFHLWALTSRFARRGPGPGPWAYAGLGLLAGLVMLVHPFTAMGAAIGMGALVAARQRRWTRSSGRWALTGAVAFAVTAWWPYFSVFSLIGDPTTDAAHRPLYHDLWGWYGLALAGLPALGWRARRDPFDPLVLMFGVGCAVAAYGWFTGHYAYGRIFGLLLVPLQFSLAVELAELTGMPRIGPWNGLHRLLLPLAAIAACAGLLAQAGAVVPRGYVPVALQRLAPWPDYRWAGARIPVGEVVLTDGYRAGRAVPAYGAYLVAPAWPDPATPLKVRQSREAAVRAYFSPSTGDEDRRRIARAYRVRWVLTQPGEPAPPDARRVASGRATGERLYRLPSPIG
jgi:hypothetical protein